MEKVLLRRGNAPAISQVEAPEFLRTGRAHAEVGRALQELTRPS